MHKLLIGIAIAMLCGSAANAAGVCEDPTVIDYIKTNLKNMKSEDGDPLAKYLGDNSKLSATTVSSQGKGFVCKIHLSVAVGGNTQKIRGRFVYREFSGGRASVTFVPF